MTVENLKRGENKMKRNHSLDGWERYYIKETESITTWKDALINSLLSWESEINEIVSFDTKNRCFNVSSNPPTYKDIIESAEMDAFEDYPNLPEWDDNNKDLEKMFREYLVEIKSICEKWEEYIMCRATEFDKRATEFDKSDEETATEYYTSFFNQFWGRS